MRKGTIILVPFPFTDLSGQKMRPALVLAAPARGADCTVAFITSSKDVRNVYAVPVTPSGLNGIKQQSLIRIDKLATLQKSLAIGELGILEPGTIKEVDRVLCALFGIL